MAVTRKRRGFTLMELMASISLLVVVMVVVTQVVGSISQLTGLSRRKMDAISEANFALDRLDADLRRAVRRADLLPFIEKSGGNDAISFYSQVNGYGGGRGISVLTYEVLPDSDGALALHRSATGTDWTTQPLSFDSASHAGAVTPGADDDQVLASAIYRVEIGFIDTATGDYVPAPATADWSDVNGIVVTVASIDAESRSQLGDGLADALTVAQGWLEDFGGTESPAAAWQEALLAHASDADLAARVMSRSLVAQRVYAW